MGVKVGENNGISMDQQNRNYLPVNYFDEKFWRWKTVGYFYGKSKTDESNLLHSQRKNVLE